MTRTTTPATPAEDLPDDWEQYANRVAAALNTALDELDRLLEEIRKRRGDQQPPTEDDPHGRPES